MLPREKKSYFKSLFTLELNNSKIELNYQSARYATLRKLNFFLSILGACFGFIFIFYSFYTSKSFDEFSLNSKILFYVDIIIFIVFICMIVLTYFFKSTKLQNYITTAFYLLNSLTFMIFSIFVYFEKKMEFFYIFIIFVLEIVLKLGLIAIFNILDGGLSIVAILLILFFNFFIIGLLKVFTNNVAYFYSSHFGQLIILSFASYFTSLRSRVSYLFEYQTEIEKLKFEKILENVSSGYLKVKNNYIEKYNKYFSENLISFRTKKRISEIVENENSNEISNNFSNQKPKKKKNLNSKNEDLNEFTMNTERININNKKFEKSSDNINNTNQVTTERNLVTENISEYELYRKNTQLILNKIFLNMQFLNEEIRYLLKSRKQQLPSFEIIQFLKKEFLFQTIKTEDATNKNSAYIPKQYSLDSIDFMFIGIKKILDSKKMYEILFRYI